MKIEFPKNFLWGISTSAYQIEGNSRNNQWWKWEKETDLEESEIACDHYHKYKEDIDLMSELGFNAYRFSIEWSRIEPEKGYFDEDEIDHYRNIINYTKEKDIELIPTIFHWTNPLWFMKEGGWTKEENVDYFIELVRKLVNEFEFDYWLTVPEPMGYAFNSCLNNKWPLPYLANNKWPQRERNLEMVFKIASNLLKAHVNSYETIHESSKGKVGLVVAMNIFDPISDSALDKWAAEILDYMYNGVLLDSLKEGKPKPPLSGDDFGDTLDFVGVNYFFRRMAYFDKNSIVPLDNVFKSKTKEYCERSQMGWEVYPEGIYRVLMRVHERFGIPIMVTSNGIATNDDLQRREFIVNHLKQIGKAMDSGVNVLGYMHWSFMDNFEWEFGFEPRFGLVEVDYHTLKRNPRRSAYMYREIVKKNGVDSEIEKKYLFK